MTLTIKVYVRVINRQSGRRENPQVSHDRVTQITVLDRCRETVQVRHEQINLIFAGALPGHIDHWQQGTQIIANVQGVIGPYAGQNHGFTHITSYYNGYLCQPAYKVK
jgi:hypothetical protein